MKLDRTTNQSGRGKYALINLRALDEAPQYQCLLDNLKAVGLLTYGNESPGEQFFVMKYRDAFTAGGLVGYADAIEAHTVALRNEISYRTPDVLEKERKNRLAQELEEYERAIRIEAASAGTVKRKLPD